MVEAAGGAGQPTRLTHYEAVRKNVEQNSSEWQQFRTAMDSKAARLDERALSTEH